jgi:hypothetical protein
MIVLPGTREIWSIGLPAPGRTALEGVTSLSRKCSSLQQEVRGFSSLRYFVIGLAGLIRCCLRYHATFIVFVSARRHKNSDYSKKALKLMRKYAKIHEHETSEHRAPRDVPLSKVSLPFRASVQAFSKKCGFFEFSVLQTTSLVVGHRL